MRGQNGEHEGQDEKGDPQIDATALKHVGRLRAKHLISHAGPESGTESFLTRALHEHQQ